MDYVTQKTGKMAAQTTGSGVVAVAAIMIIGRFVEFSDFELTMYSVALTVAFNSVIKWIEKVRKK